MSKVFLGFTVLIAIFPCQARTITVDNDGPADFSTIQAAVDAAGNGDTILIADGVYTGPGNHDIRLWGKAIKVKSENGPANCIIDCLHEGIGFIFENGEDRDSILDGITITRGFSGPGGPGGGIYCAESNPTIQNCIITGNRSCVDGGGIWSSGNPSIIGCVIEKNRATFGGGIATSGGRITDCLIVANRAGGNGGGIYGGGSEVNITNCIISGNSAGGWGGGISECGALWGKNANIRNCTISFNKAGLVYPVTDSGGLYDCYGDIRNCLVWGNIPVENKAIEGFVEFAYSCVEGGGNDNNNINIAPIFAANGSFLTYWETAPVSYWAFDEGQGYKIYDSIGINNGEFSSAEWVNGISGTALAFNDDFGFVEIRDYDYSDYYSNLDFSGQDSFTIAAWIKCNKDNSSILANGFLSGEPLENGYEIGVYQDRFRFATTHQFPGIRSVSGNTIVTDDQWHFVVAVREREADVMGVYVDGNSDSTPIGEYGEDLQNDMDVFIGQQFGGVIDEVAIYKRALELPEIRQLYQLGRAGHSYIIEPNYGDCHLRSEAGRWDPESRSWVTDDMTSPCIDAGDPNSDWTAELWPHGKRINMGAYGGTAEASMSLSIEGNIADLDNNGLIDINDFKCFAEQWLVTSSPLKEDLDRNGIVDFLDFAILGQNWQ